MRTRCPALDLRDAAALQAVVDALPNGFKPVAVLINNAGLALAPAPAQKVALEDWHSRIDTKAEGIVNVTHALLPHRIEMGEGASIINLDLVAGQ